MLSAIDLGIFATFASVLSALSPYIDISMIISTFVRYKYLKYQYIQSTKKIPFNIAECEQKSYAIIYLQQFEKIHTIYKSKSILVLNILEYTNLLIYKYETNTYSESYLFNKLCNFHDYIINYDITSKYAYNDNYIKIKDIDKFGMISCRIIISIFLFLLAFCMYYMFLK